MNRALKFKRGLSWAGLVLGGILFLAFYFAYQSASQTEELNFWVNHTQEVLRLITTVRLERSRMTNQIWAYRASHDPQLPGRFQADVVSLREDLNQLRQLLADNPEQQKRATQLAQILGQQMPALEQAMQKAVSSKDSGELPSAGTFDWSLPTPPSDQLRNLFDNLWEAERLLLAQRITAVEANARRMRMVLLMTGILTFLLGGVGGYLIQREILHRAKVEEGMRYAQALLGVKYEEQRGELTHVVEDLHENIRERQSAEERIQLLNQDLEERVRQRTRELQEMNRELEAFSYSVSHDLRAPLRHMEGFSKILQQEYGSKLPEEAQHYLKRIRNASMHMAELVEDLLHLSSIGRQLPKKRSVPVGELIEEAKTEVLAGVAGRTIEWQIDTMPQVEADPILLRQVLVNLLANAVKFTRQQPQAIIRVGSRREKEEQVFFVKDNGAGFDPRYADKLFGVFQRLHRQDEFEGTGIGLATVQRIMHKHSGRAWAESRPGEGATFYFSLPVTEERNQLEKELVGASI